MDRHKKGSVIYAQVLTSVVTCPVVLSSWYRSEAKARAGVRLNNTVPSAKMAKVTGWPKRKLRVAAAAAKNSSFNAGQFTVADEGARATLLASAQLTAKARVPTEAQNLDVIGRVLTMAAA